VGIKIRKEEAAGVTPLKNGDKRQEEPTAGREPAPEWREPALSGASSCYQWRLER